MTTQQMTRNPVTAELNVFDAVPLKHSPFVGVYELSAMHRLCFLYIFVESNSPRAGEICRRIQRTVEQHFRNSNLSITSSLNNAIKAAHFQLLDENRRSLSAHQINARITCGVLRGQDFYIGQAGTGLAYVLSQKGLRRMTNKLNPDGRIIDSLGRDEQLEVALYHHTVEEGDRILFASPILPMYVSREDVAEMLLGSREEAERQLRTVIPAEQPLSALIIRPTVLDLSLALSTTVAPRELPNIARRDQDDAGRDPGQWSMLAFAVLAVFGQLLTALGRLVLSGGRYLIGALSTTARLGADTFQPKSREEQDSDHESIVFPTKRRFPEVSAKQPSFRRSPSEPVLAVAGVAGVAVLMMIALYLVLTRPSEVPKDEAFARNLQQAKDIQRQVPSSRLAAREYLQSAGRLVDQALQIKRDDPQALDLKRQISSQLDSVNAVSPLADVRQLIDLPNPDKGADSPSTVLVGGGQLYILDQGADKVTYYTLDSGGALPATAETAVLWRRGEQWGNITVGKLAGLIWLPAGGSRQAEAALLFDDKRNLFEQVPGKGAAPLVLRDADKWGSFDGAAGFNGSLYILDRKGNQIWRYDPTQNGFDSERRPMVEIADLKDAVDIAVDGSIYVLMSDGRIARYASGLQVPFGQEEIDKPLQNPTAIFANSQTKSVYVADPVNRRVVVFGKDGKFQQQFVDDAFTGLRSIYVDEDKHHLYALTNKKLYLATLPVAAAPQKPDEKAPQKQ